MGEGGEIGQPFDVEGNRRGSSQYVGQRRRDAPAQPGKEDPLSHRFQRGKGTVLSLAESDLRIY